MYVYDSFHQSLNKNLDEKGQEEVQEHFDKVNRGLANQLIEKLLEPIFAKRMQVEISLKGNPRQQDTHSCGVFVIEYMRALSQGGEITFQTKTSRELRDNIHAELEEGRIKDTPRREDSQNPKEGSSKMHTDNKEVTKRKWDHRDERESREGSFKRTKYSNLKDRSRSMDKKQQDQLKEERNNELELNIRKTERQELERSREEVLDELENGLDGKKKSWVNTQDMRRSVVVTMEEKIKEVQYHMEEGVKAFEELKYHGQTMKRLLRNLEGHVAEDV